MTSTKKHKITITVADNGFVVENNYSSGFRKNDMELIQLDDKKDNAEVHALKELLETIQELISESSSHDAERVYILVRPGSNHRKFTKKDAEVIWGKPKDPIIEIFEEEDEHDKEST